MKSLDTIMDLVAAEFGVTRKEMRSQPRHTLLADTRHAFIKVAIECGGHVPLIANALNRHRTAVIKGYPAACDKYDVLPDFRFKVDRIITAIAMSQ